MNEMKNIGCIVEEYTNLLTKEGRLDYATGIYLKSFLRYCESHGGVMNDMLIAEWSHRRDSEKYYTHRARCIIIRRLVRHIATETGVRFSLPSYPPDPGYIHKPIRPKVCELPFRPSIISKMLEAYQSHIEASGRLNNRTMERLRRLNEFCASKYPNAKKLTACIIDDFCKRGEKESAKSRNNRVGAVREFVRFTNGRGFTTLQLPLTTPRANRCTYTPHPFTQEELAAFFAEADSFTPSYTCRDIRAALIRLELPVFFRLLYSSGMRTTEARLLERCNVDLIAGVINICQTKGYNEHRVALHESMRQALEIYDKKMDAIMPGRKTFFPNEYDRPYSDAWVSSNFKKLWKRVSNDYARAYDLRSNYAVTNINKWCGDGSTSDWDRKMVCLSRSMGHRYLQNTIYYYNLVPLFSEKLESVTGACYDELLPGLNKYFEND